MTKSSSSRDEQSAGPAADAGGQSPQGDPARAAAAAQLAQSPSDAQTFAVEVARIVAEARAEDVSVIDLRGLSSVADFFIIATGTSDRQMRAALERIREFAKTVGRKPFRVSDTDATWNLADYVDVIVHLFDAEHRTYYDLDGLWGDAPRVAWSADAQT